MRHLVFVYGTLKQGRGNSHLLASADFMGEALTVERYALSLYAPQVFDRSDIAPCWLGHVRGEVYDCDEATLAELDRLERNGEWYTRKLVPVQAEDGGPTVNAWLYFMRNNRTALAAPDTDTTHTWGKDFRYDR